MMPSVWIVRVVAGAGCCCISFYDLKMEAMSLSADVTQQFLMPGTHFSFVETKHPDRLFYTFRATFSRDWRLVLVKKCRTTDN